MKQIHGLIILIILMGLGSGVHFYQKEIRDQKIRDVTTSESEIRKLCFSENIEKRIDCLSPKLSKIENVNFANDLVIIKSGEKTKLESESHPGFIRIKRTPEMSFGGKCVSNFYLFDFDDKNVYISKDNLSGLIFCKNNNGKFLITSSNLGDDVIKSELTTLLQLSF